MRVMISKRGHGWHEVALASEDVSIGSGEQRVL